MNPESQPIANVRTITETSWGEVHHIIGIKQSISTNRNRKIIKRIYDIPVSKQTFYFQNNVYHFTHIPYMIKNSLVGFITSLQQMLGAESTDYMSVCRQP